MPEREINPRIGEAKLTIVTGVYGDEMGTQAITLTHIDQELLQELATALDFGVNDMEGGVTRAHLVLVAEVAPGKEVID